MQLFVERATAVMEDFALTDTHAPLVADICRRLDGLPLAIEFAAARVGVLGIRGLAAHLGDSLQLLGTRRHTAMLRDRTMQAVIDWSYGLLTEDEQRFFRRLALFAGSFSAEAAGRLSGEPAQPLGITIDFIADLVVKSLLTADISGAEPRFRLLGTTRAYALEKLGESGELQALARCHAEYYCYLFERAGAEWKTRPATEWLAAYAHHIDNLRAALDWAFSPEGDESIGVALAAASVPIWFEISLLNECRCWMEKVLSVLDAGDRAISREMVLQCGLGYALMFAQGMNDRARAPLTRASELAERLADADYQLRALAGLAAICHRLQDSHGAVALGRRAEETVRGSSDPVALSMEIGFLVPPFSCSESTPRP
jgi:predicted ATPase